MWVIGRIRWVPRVIFSVRQMIMRAAKRIMSVGAVIVKVRRCGMVISRIMVIVTNWMMKVGIGKS